MRLNLALGLALVALPAPLLTTAGLAETPGASGTTVTRTFATRDPRTFDSQRPAPYTRSNATPLPAAKRSRPAGFAQVQNYYPGARNGQSVNRNVVDPRGLCVPGRRALIPR